MPHNKTAKCPKCQELNSYDLDDLKARYGVVYRTLAPKWREYAVTCRHCGHEFKLRVKEASDERPG